MDTLRHMHLFVEVASAGGFRAASERLRVPNSTLSRRVAELERELGIRLFHRTTRKVELTEAGSLYFERCRRIVAEAKLAQEELSGMVTAPTGLIRVSAPVDFTVVYLSRILADFLALYPGVRLDLDVSPRESDLVSDPVDVAIRIGEPKAPQVIARRLRLFARALYAAPVYLAKREAPHCPEDLLAHDYLSMNDRPWRLIHAGTGEARVLAATGPLIANNVGLLRELALQGAGVVALPPEIANPDVIAGRLAPLLPDWRPPPIPVHALTETRLVPAKVRVFIDFLVQRLKGGHEPADPAR